MIQAQEYFEYANKYGYRYYTGVPCSLLTPFINAAINSNSLEYISAANEGDAIAIAAGAFIGGQRSVVMMQNSGLGNAVNPLASLIHPFRIPVLIIVTLRGDPQEKKDEPQHELMGKITGSLLESMDIPWEYFPTETDAIEPALARADNHMIQKQLPYAFIMRKGSVAPHKLAVSGNTSPFQEGNKNFVKRFLARGTDGISRNEALSYIVKNTSENRTVIIATTGYTGRELFALADRPNHFYMVGSMGCASSLALGLSLARSDLDVIVIDGDGAAFMRMGNFATIGARCGSNLTHVLLDNGVHDSTGGQATTSHEVSFARIAAACGYAICVDGNSVEVLHDLFNDQNSNGPRFGHLKIRRGTSSQLPRPNLKPDEVRTRLMVHINSKIEIVNSVEAVN